MHGVRGDSIFFVYFFLTSATIAASVVLGIALLQWAVVILALTVVLSAEMFNQSVKSLFAALGRPTDDKVKAALTYRFGGRLCRDPRLGPHDRPDPRQSRTADVSGGLIQEHDTVSPEPRTFVATAGQSGLTVLAALRQWLPGASWSAVRKLLAGRHVAINQSLCLDEARRLKAGETVTLHHATLRPTSDGRGCASGLARRGRRRRRQAGRHDDIAARGGA